MEIGMSGQALSGSLAGTYSTYASSSLFIGTVSNPVPAAGLLTSQNFSAGSLNGTCYRTSNEHSSICFNSNNKNYVWRWFF